MAFIIWNDDLMIHVHQIDTEHQQLVDLVNRFHESMLLGHEQQILDQVLPDLIAATRSHFESEENLMSQYQYPDLIIQHMIHQNLLAQIIDLSQRIQQGEVKLTGETLDFLVEWLNDHIRRDDRKFGDFLHQKGLA